MPFDNAPLHNVFLAVRQILPSSSYAAFMRAVHMAASMVALVGMFCAVPLAAQLAKPEKSRILSIDVEGNSTIDKSAIINLSGLLIGDEIIVTPGLPNAQLADAIKALDRLDIELAREIVARDREIDAARNAIDEHVF